jgi:SAM-dependent methyltransferase
MSQTNVVRDSEADAWWRRNRDKLPPKDDPVLTLIKRNQFPFQTVLEVGCANGWRLNELRRKYHCRTIGCDLSYAALDDGRKRFSLDHLYYSAANHLQYTARDECDLVILGFFLYLADRGDLFEIVAESDRVLKDGGHLIINDFDSATPQTVPYHHDPRLHTYKMAYWKLWTANPAYTLRHVMVGPDATTCAWLLKKDLNVWREPCLLASLDSDQSESDTRLMPGDWDTTP